MKRKIIQISESGASDFWQLSALCNDGTVWYRNDVRSSWIRYPDIPQDTEKAEPESQECTGKARVSISPEGPDTGEGWEAIEVNDEADLSKEEKKTTYRVVSSHEIAKWIEKEIAEGRAYISGHTGLIWSTHNKWRWGFEYIEWCGKPVQRCSDGTFSYQGVTIPDAWVEEVTE